MKKILVSCLLMLTFGVSATETYDRFPQSYDFLLKFDVEKFLAIPKVTERLKDCPATDAIEELNQLGLTHDNFKTVYISGENNSLANLKGRNAEAAKNIKAAMIIEFKGNIDFDGIIAKATEKKGDKVSSEVINNTSVMTLTMPKGAISVAAIEDNILLLSTPTGCINRL